MCSIDFLYRCTWCFTIVLVNTFLETRAIPSTPPEFCLHKFNNSDCGGTPTPVAYYYKPGSRCEIATWKGCPTGNKFPNEIICSHICIARLAHWGSGENLNDITQDEANIIESEDDQLEEWKNELEHVPDEDMEVIDDLVNIAMEGEGATSKKVVKLHGPVDNAVVVSGEDQNQDGGQPDADAHDVQPDADVGPAEDGDAAHNENAEPEATNDGGEPAAEETNAEETNAEETTPKPAEPEMDYGSAEGIVTT